MRFRQPDLPARLRIIAVGLLLVLVSLGLRALAAARLPGPPALGSRELWLLLVVGWAGLLTLALAAVVAVMGRRWRAPATLAASRGGRPGAALVMVALLLALNPAVLERIRRRLHAFTNAAPGEGAASRPDPSGGHLTVPASTVMLLVAVVTLLVLTGVIALLRARASPAPPPLTADPAVQRLAHLVAAGQRALAKPRDPREAIIACYLAMEEALARVGAARSAAETAAELLDRAEEAGLVPRTPADRLLALFAEARFSSHRLGPVEREQAEAALAELREALERARAQP